VVGLERGPLSLVSTTEELLVRNSSGSENTAVGIRHADYVALSIHEKIGANFADKRLSLGRCSGLRSRSFFLYNLSSGAMALKKSFATSKAYINLSRGHVLCFELS
jgi:hypothetical protein